MLSYKKLLNEISYAIYKSINESRNIGHRTIDRKLWLSVASVCSKNKSTEAEFIKPMKKLSVEDLLNRYIAALLIMKKPCPASIQDIEKIKTFKLFALKALDLGATFDDIRNLYDINSGAVSTTRSAQQAPKTDVISKPHRDKQYIIDTIKKYGESNQIRLPKDYQTSNNWNAQVTGVYYYEAKNRLFINIYVQGDSTDTDTSVIFDDFLKPGTYTDRTENHGFSYSFNNNVKQKAINLIYDYMDELNNGLGAQIKNKKKINEYIFDWRIINPILDKWYDRYHLRLAYSAVYSAKPGTRDYDAKKAYETAEKQLRAYITDNAHELINKSKQELSKIYTEVFKNAFNDNFKW